MAVTEETVLAVYKRAKNKCEICGDGHRRGDRFTLNHCLYHRQKDKPFLDVEENLQLAHWSCHDKVGHGKQNRIDFWISQCGYYGKEHMVVWNENLPLKAKMYFD